MNLDQEWIELIIEAKSLGISIDDVQSFLHLESSNIKDDGEKE